MTQVVNSLERRPFTDAALESATSIKTQWSSVVIRALGRVRPFCLISWRVILGEMVVVLADTTTLHASALPKLRNRIQDKCSRLVVLSLNSRICQNVKNVVLVFTQHRSTKSHWKTRAWLLVALQVGVAFVTADRQREREREKERESVCVYVRAHTHTHTQQRATEYTCAHMFLVSEST